VGGLALIACLAASPAAAQGQGAGAAPQTDPAAGAQRQPPSRPPGAGPARLGRAGLPANPDVMNAAQVERYFDGYMILQARTALQLSDDQYFTIGPRLERLQELRRQAQRQRRQLIGELREMLRTQAPVDDAVITAKVKALDDVPSQFAEPIRKAYAEIDGTLTPRQRARFRAFEEMMEQQKLDLIARARQQVKPDTPPQGDAPAKPATPARGGGGRR
jgi:hypothetical protein